MPLLDRLAALMAPHAPRVQKMFGGTAFLVNENLVIGTLRDGLIVRVGPEGMAAALAEPHATQMEMGGRAMAGWILVAAPGAATDAQLQAWVARGLDHNRSLPPKVAGRKTKATPRG